MRKLFVWMLLPVWVVTINLIIMPYTVSGPSAASEKSDSQKIFNWRFQEYHMFSLYPAKRSVEFAKAVKERTNGRLNITVAPPGTHGYSGFELHQVTGRGLLDMAVSMTGAIKELPIMLALSHYIFERPAIMVKILDIVENDLSKKLTPKNLNVLGSYTFASTGWVSTKPFETLDAFKGSKLRVWDPVQAEYVKRLGAVGHFIPYAETYTSLATGVVQGNLGGARAGLDLKLNEICPYYNVWLELLSDYFYLANSRSYNALPPDLKDILNQEIKKAEKDVRNYFLTVDNTQEEDWKAAGGKLIYPSKEEMNKARVVRVQLFKEYYNTLDASDKAIADKIIKPLGFKIE